MVNFKHPVSYAGFIKAYREEQEEEDEYDLLLFCLFAVVFSIKTMTVKTQMRPPRMWSWWSSMTLYIAYQVIVVIFCA